MEQSPLETALVNAFHVDWEERPMLRRQAVKIARLDSFPMTTISVNHVLRGLFLVHSRPPSVCRVRVDLGRMSQIAAAHYARQENFPLLANHASSALGTRFHKYPGYVHAYPVD